MHTQQHSAGPVFPSPVYHPQHCLSSGINEKYHPFSFWSAVSHYDHLLSGTWTTKMFLQRSPTAWKHRSSNVTTSLHISVTFQVQQTFFRHKNIFTNATLVIIPFKERDTEPYSDTLQSYKAVFFLVVCSHFHTSQSEFSMAGTKAHCSPTAPILQVTWLCITHTETLGNYLEINQYRR